ncbi:hypothetical protein [Aquirhabdus parva]|uniref:Uncharacterized protein n=1 Tax=Aquirhabdus parva TaxID=2283318 RepID=A0A345P7J6_9GAMM|nr:hypothetical protein [Aquirhabdus parva]AXI03255.1 hypothetical protein HYN46_10630 [Aquirhabdus parva]
MAVRSNRQPIAQSQKKAVQHVMPSLVKVAVIMSVVPFMLSLSACQSYKELETKPVWMMPSLNNANIDSSGIASVHCAGGVGCQFVALNGVQLLNTVTGEPTERSKTDAVLRFESPTSYSSQYYLALSSAPHDVDVQFFPITRSRVENFSVTHRFRAGHRYDLNLYRQSREQSGSLLSLAGPAPLCIDLLDNNQLSRRFCRSYDFQAGTSSFVEQKIK